MTDPIINTGHAYNLENFIHVILRKDYGWSVNTYVDTNLRFLGVKAFATHLYFELGIPILSLSLLGMFYLIFKKKYQLFLALFSGFLLTGPVYIIYGLLPLTDEFTRGVLERFYMISVLFFLLFTSFGILMLLQITRWIFFHIHIQKKRIELYNQIILALLILFPLSLFVRNFSKTDLSNVYIGEYLGYDVLSQVPKNSVLYLNGDNVVYNTLAVQYGSNFRKDVAVINVFNYTNSKEYISQQKQYKMAHPKFKEKDVAKVLYLFIQIDPYIL
jgi:hypothetical protein